MALTILLADDSMTAQKMGKEILVSAGYEVIAVSNGAAAAKKLADKPDIAILDIIMPGYTGLEICEKIRASMDTAKTPVILTVGKMEHYDPQDIARVKADGVIIKPFEATDLLATIKKFEQKLAAAAAPPEAAYEKTMILDRAQIQEFKDASYDEWKTDAPAQEEMDVPPPPPLEMSQEMGSAPAFADDFMSAPSPTSHDETVTIPPPLKAAAAVAAPAFDETVTYPPPIPAVSSTDETVTFMAPPVPPVFEAMEAPAPIMMEPVAPSAPSTDPEVEFTSAPRGQDAKVVVEAALEADNIEVPQILPDPSLVTDPTTMATEFATKFGTEKEDIEGYVPGFDKPGEETGAIEAVAAPAADDDFEARVAAAMSSFDAPSEAPAPVEVEGAPAPVEVAPIEVSDAPVAIDVPAPIEVEVPAPVEVAAVEPPAHIDTQKIEAVVEQEPMIPEVAESQLPPEGMQDAALVEQMQAAFADLPVAPPAPVEEPVVEAPIAAAVPEPVPAAAAVAPTSTAHPDMELASALAAAVGAEPPAPQVPAGMAAPVAAAAAAGAPGLDPHTVASVVSKVMERMLPSIMTEVAKELDNAKKS